jgi:hypothetical protein
MARRSGNVTDEIMKYLEYSTLLSASVSFGKIRVHYGKEAALFKELKKQMYIFLSISHATK